MTKSVRKLQAEIDRALKQVDEGIHNLDQLETRLENANSLQMKEKIETEIKKEIKKLQRHRDFFKQLMKDSEVKDKTKIVEARHRIEEQMEKFRELEKEYKQKKLTKVKYQTHNELENKYIDGSEDESDSQSNHSSGQESQDNDYASGGQNSRSQSDSEYAVRKGSMDAQTADDQESAQLPSAADKEWFNMLLVSMLREISTKVENHIAALRQGGSKKKNKQQVTAMHVRTLEQRLQTNNMLLNKVQEIQPLLELVDSQRIRKIEAIAMPYIRAGGEHDHNSLSNELELVIQQFEANQLPLQLQQDKQDPADDAKAQQMRDIQLAYPECVTTEEPVFEDLQIGAICDAQDYLGGWHLAVVIDQALNAKHLHFLPFKANRDEWLKSDEDGPQRISAVFSMTGFPPKNLQQSFGTLRNYCEQYRQKVMKKTSSGVEESKSQGKLSNQQKIQQPADKNGKGKKSAQRAVEKPTPLFQQTLQSAPFNPHSVGSGNTPNSEVGLGKNNNNKVREISDDQVNQQAQKMATNSSVLQPKKGSTNSALQGLTPMGREEPPPKSSLEPNAPNASQQTMSNAPLFQGNPFAFKGINKPKELNQFSSAPGTAPDEVQSNDGLKPFSLPKPQLGFQMDSKALAQGNDTSPSSRLASNQGKKQPNTGSSAIPVKMQQQSKLKRTRDLLEVSYIDKPEPEDQEVIDPKQPVGVWPKHSYPTVPMYTHAANFARFDHETLFFAFYYQQETYQQYLAAVELKKEHWMFNKRFETWFKKVEDKGGFNAQPGTEGKQQRRKEIGKYQYFDFENKWAKKVSGDDIEMDMNHIENELIVQQSDQQPFMAGGQPPSRQTARSNEGEGLNHQGLTVGGGATPTQQSRVSQQYHQQQQ